MTTDQREAEIRRRVGRFHALTIDDKMAVPGFAFGCMSDEAFLVAVINDLRRQLSHAPTAVDMPAASPATPATTMEAVAWDADAALAAAAARVDAALMQAVRDHADPYATRIRVAIAINALRRGARQQLPPLPPDEPPPFAVG